MLQNKPKYNNVLQMKENVEDKFQAVISILEDLQNTYKFFIEKENKNARNKYLELIGEMNNKILKIKKILVIDVQEEIIPNITEDFQHLEQILEQLEALENMLIEHLQILENMKDTKGKFEFNAQYEISQIEIIRVYGMLQIQIIMIGNIIWRRINEKLKKRRRKCSEPMNNCFVREENILGDADYSSPPITSSQEDNNTSNISENKEEEKDSSMVLPLSASDYNYQTKTLYPMGADPPSPIHSHQSITSSNINTQAQIFWNQCNNHDECMSLDRFNTKLDQYLCTVGLRCPYWAYCNIINRQHNLSVNIHEVSDVFNIIPQFTQKYPPINETEDHYFLQLLDKTCKSPTKSLKLRVFKADRTSLLETQIIRGKDLPYSVGTGMLANCCVTDPAIAIKQFEIISYDSCLDQTIQDNFHRFAMVCHSNYKLTLFQVPPYPCKVKLIADLYIFLGCCNNYRYRVKTCINTFNYVEVRGENMDFLDPWKFVRQYEKGSLGISEGDAEGERSKSLKEAILVLVNEDRIISAYQEHNLTLIPRESNQIFTIGRARGQYIKFEECETPISQKHCYIGYDEKLGWYIGENIVPSTNGTFIALNTAQKLEDSQPSYPFLLSNEMRFVAGNHAFFTKEMTE